MDAGTRLVADAGEREGAHPFHRAPQGVRPIGCADRGLWYVTGDKVLRVLFCHLGRNPREIRGEEGRQEVKDIVQASPPVQHDSWYRFVPGIADGNGME